MQTPSTNLFRRCLALFSIVPFLLGFEPRRDDGFTVGLGGSAGRGHYSTGCGQRRYQQEYAAVSQSLDYTFAPDSARGYRPHLTIGGRLAAAGTETILIEDEDSDPQWLAEDARTVNRHAVLAGLLLRMDWAYLGIGLGCHFPASEWSQGDLKFPVLPVADIRVGPWKDVYLTASMGGGFALPVPVPFDFASGVGWDGSRFGAWLGLASSVYPASESILTLSYRYHGVTVLGSVGMYLDDDGSFQGHYGFGDYSRAAFGIRYGIKR